MGGWRYLGRELGTGHGKVWYGVRMRVRFCGQVRRSSRAVFVRRHTSSQRYQLPRNESPIADKCSPLSEAQYQIPRATATLGRGCIMRLLVSPREIQILRLSERDVVSTRGFGTVWSRRRVMGRMGIDLARRGGWWLHGLRAGEMGKERARG